MFNTKMHVQIMTATVETMVEQLDVATLMPTEHVLSALARSITVSDSDVGESYNPLINLKLYIMRWADLSKMFEKSILNIKCLCFQKNYLK